MQSKKCGKCKIVKDVGEFSKNIRQKFGLQNTCKVCKEISEKAYRLKNKEKVKACIRAWGQRNKARIRANYDKIRTTISKKYSQLTGHAKVKEIQVLLTLTEYAEIIKTRTCYYCDYNFSNEGGSNLNRVDSEKHYTLDNVRPCCKICNSIMNRFTKEELRTRVYKIVQRMD